MHIKHLLAYAFASTYAYLVAAYRQHAYEPTAPNYSLCCTVTAKPMERI